MDQLHEFYYFLDMAGTFVFAVSGATAARSQGLDVFGIIVIAFIVACGGGIIRDLCIGSIPPSGLSTWKYLFISVSGAVLTMGLFSIVMRMSKPVLFFDALGLSLFAVTGAQKSLAYGHNVQVAILLGVVTAVGGGVIRDVLLNKVPVILQKEIYALAALIASSIVVLGSFIPSVSMDLWSVIALVVCCSLRLMSLYFKWNLPTFSDDVKRVKDKTKYY